MPKFKRTEKNRRKRYVTRYVRSLKPTERHKSNVCPIEIELRNDFKQIVLASNNPAIELAKSSNTSYTVAVGLDIVEVKGVEHRVVGRIAKSDVPLSKGAVYKLSK